MLGGLLSIGDRRVVELVTSQLSSLDLAGEERLAATIMASAFAPVLDFYADWMEMLIDAKLPDDHSRVLGTVANCLADTPRRAAPQQVIEINRAFPATSRESFVVVRTWSFAEYRTILEQRLALVIVREPEPGIVAMALNGWGSAYRPTGPRRTDEDR